MLKTGTRILLPVVGGTLIGKFATSNAREDYEKYEDPPFSPPGYVFPIVWPALYTTMGIAYHYARRSDDNAEVPISHYTQLGLNYVWSLLYFKYKLRGTALIESYALLAAVLIMAVNFYKNNKFSGLLMMPYVMWASYATYLNGGNWLLNKDKENYAEE